MIGCDRLLAERAATPHVARAILSAMEKATRFFAQLGHGSFAPGNAEGGLTTIEEKSLGAYCKSGSMPIAGVLLPGEAPIHKGLYLMDKIPDGPVRYGYSDATDNVGIAEMIACGAHLVLFSTGRGSVVGSAVAPVIKICANPDTYRSCRTTWISTLVGCWKEPRPLPRWATKSSNWCCAWPPANNRAQSASATRSSY